MVIQMTAEVTWWIFLAVKNLIRSLCPQELENGTELHFVNLEMTQTRPSY